MIDLLILTSCIQPPKQDFLKLVNTDQRLEQTLTCVKFYIDSSAFQRIIICDGSNYQLDNTGISEYAAKHNVKLEILTFNQDFEKVAEFGKGYGEGEIMKYIVRNSILYKESSFFIKITGRLRIKNIKEITVKMKSMHTYFNIFPSRYIGCVDTRIYGIGTNLYEELFLDVYKQVDDRNRRSYEFCFTDTIKQNSLDITCFPEVPQIEGISGTNNKAYKLDAVYYTECLLTKLNLMNTSFSSYLILIVRTISNLI